jgi:hypothetical protein
MVLLGAVLIAAAPLAAQDWRAELSEELVTIQGGKMVIEDQALFKMNLTGYEPWQMQVQVHSEAPQGGIISRDMFVSLTSSMFYMVFVQALAEAYQVPASQFIEGLDVTDLEAIIGTPDMQLNLFMTNEGIQVEVVNTATGERSRQTSTWEEWYGR